MIFAGMFQPREVKEKRLAQTEALRDEGLGLPMRSREEPLVLDSVVDHGKAFDRQPEMGADIAGSVLADDDDAVLAAGKPASHHPSVKHTPPIVSSGDVEGCQ